MGGLAIFMLVTAVVVMVPVLLQIRMRETRARETWGFMVFAAGLLVIAAADTTIGRPRFATIFAIGLVLILSGLILQARRKAQDHQSGA